MIALPAALGAIFFALLAVREWRDALLGALIWFGLLVTLITEALGAIHELSRAPLFSAWCAVLVASGGLAFLRWRSAERQEANWTQPSVLDAVCVLGVSAILITVGLIAWISPPNSTDAMAYHLPRIVYWAQQRSVAFFPTDYYNQIMLQPLAEYFMLHTFVLSGGDRWVNFVQWLGMAGSVAAVSSIAQLFGAQRRGQVIAALFCATLPNGILQASGAKNDYLLALWLACLAYFAMRFAADQKREDLFYCVSALALALFTKATAYLFAPGLLVAISLPVWRAFPARRLVWAGVALVAGVLVVNGAQYARNVGLTGSPLGYDSAHGDGFFRWRNESFGWRQTSSNLARNLADQLGGPSPAWNQQVYSVVVWFHRFIGADVNNPDTTWRWTTYEPPRYANHETNANNRWHLLILFAVCIALAARAMRLGPSSELWYLLGVLAGFVLFCFYLKWQLFLARMFLPLFVLASPVAGVELGKLRPLAAQWLLCLFLLNNSRPFLLENWVRPLKGANSILRTSRDDQYFADMKPWNNRESYLRAVDLMSRDQCEQIGIDIHEFPLEYPFQALMRERKPDVQFDHTGVNNESTKYARRQPNRACAVLCMDCAGKPDRLNRYHDFPKVSQAGEFVMFFR